MGHDDAGGVPPAHAIAAGSPPRYHGDPFDRMLIARTVVENLILVSGDRQITRYDARIFDGRGR